MRVFALLPGNRAQEGDDVVGYVVLKGGAITNGVDITQGSPDNS